MDELGNYVAPLYEKHEPTQKASLKACSTDQMTTGTIKKRRAAAIEASEKIKKQFELKIGPPQRKKLKKKEFVKVKKENESKTEPPQQKELKKKESVKVKKEIESKTEPPQQKELKEKESEKVTKTEPPQLKDLEKKESMKVKKEIESKTAPPQQKKLEKKESRRAKLIPKREKYMPIIELFFSSLLKSSSYNDFFRSNADEEVRNKILSEACSMINVPLPGPLPSVQTTKAEFYDTRAALVIEESRAILSTSITNLNKDDTPAKNSSMILSLIYVKHLKSGNLSLLFERSETNGLGCQSALGFSPGGTCTMKPGCCFGLTPLTLPGGQHQEIRNPIILPISQLKPFSEEEGLGEETRLEFMCFQKDFFNAIQMMPPGTKWSCWPLTSLIGQLRQFEVCMKAPHVDFLPSLLGVGQKLHGTHIRFNDADSSHESVGKENKLEAKDAVEKTESSISKNPTLEACSILSLFKLPTLNPVQQSVIDAFLSSKSTLSVVQGPPGTGKTELIVSLLFRSLAQSREHRIMVCAPTNKAILAITKRFLSIWKGNTLFNCILVGVQEELIGSTQEGNSHVAADCVEPSMRGVFLYTWLESFTAKAQNVLCNINSSFYQKNLLQLLHQISSLFQQLNHSIPIQAEKTNSLQTLRSVLDAVKEILLSSEQGIPVVTCRWQNVSDTFNSFLASVSKIDQKSAVKELVSTANIIFCTLHTSGISLLKYSRKINDLVIDEAAAATEVDCCIPFFLQPRRLLVVGDPLQLPATIYSNRAKMWGLEKSLHHRLMYECNHPFTMLEFQYRMRPSISYFPSSKFYGGKIVNGSNVVSPLYKGDVAILGDRHFSFINVVGMEHRNQFGSYGNVREASVVVQLISELRQKCNNKYGMANCLSWYSAERVRVITFYSEQVAQINRSLMKANLSGVTVATVDSSQGSEADLVIVSFVRSKGLAQHDSVGFLSDDRRLNVALTRARYQLVCVGNVNGSLRSAPKGAIKDLIKWSVDQGHTI